MTRRISHILISLCLLAVTAGAQEATASAELTPGPAHPLTQPYAVALLKLTNPTDAECVAVRLRWQGGGPAMFASAAVLPGKTADVSVVLPPLAASQVYDIELLDRAGQTLARQSAEIAWPPEAVATDAFVNPIAYDPYKDDYPAWSGRLKRMAMLVAAIYAAVLIGTTLIRPPQARLVVVVLVVVAGSVAVLWREQPVVQEDIDDGMVILRTRRTTQAVLGSPEAGILTPIYRSPRQMREDDLAIHPGRGGALILRPEDIRIFRWPEKTNLPQSRRGDE